MWLVSMGPHIDWDPFPPISRYGVDKPDLRFGSPIVDLRAALRTCGLAALEAAAARQDCTIGGVFFPSTDLKAARRVEKEVRAMFADQLEAEGREGEAVITSATSTLGGEVAGSLARKLGTGSRTALAAAAGEGMVGVVVAGRSGAAAPVLGRARSLLAEVLVPDLAARPHAFTWVVDFPLFLEEEGAVEAAHHPFTAVHAEDRAWWRSKPLEARSLHYDLVVDGQEVRGHSV